MARQVEGLSSIHMNRPVQGAFLGADHDFVRESNNSADDIWRILEGQNYPKLVQQQKYRIQGLQKLELLKTVR